MSHAGEAQRADHGPSIDLAGATVRIEDSDATLGLEYHLDGTLGVLKQFAVGGHVRHRRQ